MAERDAIDDDMILLQLGYRSPRKAQDPEDSAEPRKEHTIINMLMAQSPGTDVRISTTSFPTSLHRCQQRLRGCKAG